MTSTSSSTTVAAATSSWNRSGTEVSLGQLLYVQLMPRWQSSLNLDWRRRWG